jgi:hypothetical protein
MTALLNLRTLFRPPPPPASSPVPFVPAPAQPPRAPSTLLASVSPRPLDTFDVSPSKPPVVHLGGDAGTPVSPYPPTADILRYERAKQQAPQFKDFPNLQEYLHAHVAYQRELLQLAEAAGEDYLGYIEQEAQQTPTGNAIIDAAREAGVEAVVLPDEEYQRRYPGTAGVHADGAVYVPVSSIDDPSDSNDVDVVVHEYVHALIGDELDPNKPQLLRPALAAKAFAELGLPPEAGAEIARQTDDWESGVAVEHVVTAYVTRRMERERQGLPPESPEEEAAAIGRISDRELSLHLQGAREGEPPLSDAELVEQWENTPTGQRYPPEGNTEAEKAAWIEERMETLSDPAYVDPTLPGDKFPK